MRLKKRRATNMNRIYTTNIEQMLKDGYTRKFGNKYLRTISAEMTNSAYDQKYVKWAHEHGFFAECAYAYGLNDDNYKDYLSDYDYYLIWPLNSWQKIWINDKLTLKYMLADTEYGSIMPEYYYYNADGNMIALLDNPYKGKEFKFTDFVAILKKIGIMACKPCNGTTSLGFFKLSYEGGGFFKDDKEIEKSELESLIKAQKNYIFTEYIKPSQQFEAYSPLIHTLRIVVINEHGYDPKIICGYLRIPNSLSGSANYIVLTGENVSKYNIFMGLNTKTGEYGPGKLTYVDRVICSDIHPDLGIPLSGKIENYDELKHLVLGISERFNTCSYLGFDIGVTNKGFKCMEINSHPGIKYLQIFNPLLKNEQTKDFFNKKIDEILYMSAEDKKKRENTK